jgi:hypothetical protein
MCTLQKLAFRQVYPDYVNVAALGPHTCTWCCTQDVYITSIGSVPIHGTESGTFVYMT